MIRILVLLLLATNLSGQIPINSKEFPLDSFLNIVRQNHPFMRQAALLEGKANAALMESRGAFDPKIYGDYENKFFDEKNYYKKGEGGLKIPTWIGADLKLAYAWTNGIFLNSSDNLPPNGQAIAGIEMPLAQGLFFDQRRAQIQLAKLLQERNETERQIMINDFLMDATASYWNWVLQYQTVKIYQQALQLGKDRFELIKESFLQGDKPAIDTIESLILVQNRELLLRQAEVDLENKGLELSNYLWTKEQIPLEITSILRPENLESDWVQSPNDLLTGRLNNTVNNHPTLINIQIKQQQLDVKEKLKKEGLKPRLNLSYNFLADGFDFSSDKSEGSNFQSIFTENYKWGVELNYPLFLRKERGGLEMVRLEKLETAYKLQEKRLNIQNKIQIVIQQLEMTTEQVAIQSNVLENYQTLLNVEIEKFRIGESSIFLLNSREQKLMETQLKLAKLQSKYQKLRRKLDWASGQLR